MEYCKKFESYAKNAIEGISGGVATGNCGGQVGEDVNCGKQCAIISFHCGLQWKPLFFVHQNPSKLHLQVILFCLMPHMSVLM